MRTESEIIETRPLRSSAIGDHLRVWRQRRRLSQLDLACEAEISTRHLSFLETGRAMPSREMVLHLAESLEVPLRERNTLLLAAGFAPIFGEHPLDDPDFAVVREAIHAILKAHEPYPALAVDGHWTMVASNAALLPLVKGVADHLLRPPVNALRLSLHPEGLAPRIRNLAEWPSHLLARLRRQAAATADPVLAMLHDELSGYPISRVVQADRTAAGLAMPLELMTDAGLLSLLSTTMMFGTPRDVTLAEIAIETFLPADASTSAALGLSG